MLWTRSGEVKFSLGLPLPVSLVYKLLATLPKSFVTFTTCPEEAKLKWYGYRAAKQRARKIWEFAWPLSWLASSLVVIILSWVGLPM